MLGTQMILASRMWLYLMKYQAENQFVIACFNYLVGLCPNRQAGATSDGSNGNELAIFLQLFIYLFFSETLLFSWLQKCQSVQLNKTYLCIATWCQVLDPTAEKQYTLTIEGKLFMWKIRKSKRKKKQPHHYTTSWMTILDLKISLPLNSETA